MDQYGPANLICAATLERQRRIVALEKELREWGQRWGLGWNESWDDRAMRIINSERRRILKELRALGWRE